MTPTPGTTPITVACLDMAGTNVADDGSVIAVFSAAVEQFGAGLVAGVLTGSASREDMERAQAPVILDTIAGLLPLAGAGAG